MAKRMAPQEALEKAKEAYPEAFFDGVSRWQLVDVYEISDRNPAYKGLLVLQEYRGEEPRPYNWWGLMVHRSTIEEEP